ncbi:2-dehydro-3-deoxygalactonokinase [Vibrio sp.]|nr:2-dehydro-3-deoxygalactonokinase [Vibrio sp.]
MNQKEISWCIVDWGTSNFRLFAMNDDKQIVDKIESNIGLMKVVDGDFSTALENQLNTLIPDHYHSLPIMMAGMVGSANGWHPVDYIDAPATLDSLVNHCFSFTLPWGANAKIVPGVKVCNTDGIYDVMRGEEVQFFGLQGILNKKDAFAIFPGTHSKHIELQNNLLDHFKSFMTGELFDLLSKHSILSLNLPEQVQSQKAFSKGIKESGGIDITSRLFAARTHRLFGLIQESEVLDYLSGLLIGQELKSVSHKEAFLIGGELLCERYALACELLQIKTQTINGDEAFIKGMIRLFEAQNA